jgi:hypothetical protein
MPTSVLWLLGLWGCSDTSPEAVDMAPDLAQPVSTAKHNIHTTIALEADAQGVGVYAQNGVLVHIPKDMLVGKHFGWLILNGGEQAANGKKLELGIGTVDPQLHAEFSTQKGYPDGPWELAVLILVASSSLLNAPNPGDLAAYDLTPPPAGEPPVTGTSVRVTLKGADADVTLSNRYFIKL